MLCNLAGPYHPVKNFRLRYPQRPSPVQECFYRCLSAGRADAIALQEDIRKEGDYIILQESVKPGQFVRPKGLDFNEGEVLLSSGTPLGARHLALAGLAGHTKLPVRKSR